jgi:hypothetical protein
MNLWQSREWRSVLEVPIQSSRADRALLQIPAPPDFEWEPVQAIRRVGREVLERRHFTNLGWNADKVASIENEVLDGFQSRDARGERR